MSDKNEKVVAIDSMQMATESMKTSTASTRSSKPNTTNVTQAKPAFTPPAQKPEKKDS